MYSLTIEDSNGQIAEQFSFDHGSYLIGRQENCDIVLPSSSVSRQHANIFVRDGRCYIEDLNSANGVTVDGQRVVKQRHLGTASQVRIGDYYLYLEYKADDQLEDQDVRQTLFISDSPDHNKLVRVNDEFAGEEFILSEIDNTIGRTDENFILLSDPSISREHALITRNGDVYTLMDLGSSNGTRVNNQEVDSPTQLEPGDVVEFGSVEFVYAQGDQEVDPSEYAGHDSSTNKVLLIAGFTVVMLVGLVAGGLIVFSFWSMNDQQAGGPAAQRASIDNEASQLLEEGEQHLDRKKWDEAIDTLNEALAVEPNHPKAKQLRKRARREKDADQLYDKGVELSQEGEYRKALEILQKIPEETTAFERSESTREHVRKTISFRLRNKAKKLLSSDTTDEELKEARDKLERATSLDPENSKAENLLEGVNSKVEERGLKDETVAGEE
jgi:pSer/pThr/pTyr-binding forkhead associated (FHA) protein/outer membrane protein assembly factor BamD (BamD/ComL family)